MAEGTSTFMGRGVGLDGNYEIQGDSETLDVLTITGASSSASGDLLVVQNSTGTEFLVISSSGKFSLAGNYAGAISAGLAVSGSMTHSGGLTTTVSSTTQYGGLVVSITSSGALATGATNVNGIVVVPSSAGVTNTAFLYAASEGQATNSLLGVSGSLAPVAFLQIGSSAGYGTGAGNVSGAIGVTMFTAASSYYLTSALATTMPLGLLKVLAGSKVFYIPLLTDTMIGAA